MKWLCSLVALANFWLDGGALPDRDHYRALIAQTLMDRYMLPLDSWIQEGGVNALIPGQWPSYSNPGSPQWYCLLIKTSNQFREPPVWVKYRVDPKKAWRPHDHSGYEEWDYCDKCGNVVGETADDNCFRPDLYHKEIRGGVFRALEQFFITIILSGNKDHIRTITLGKAELHTITDERSTIDQLTPRSRVY